MTNPSIQAYNEVCKILRVKPEKITEKFEEVENATLVIVPDKAFDWQSLSNLATEFGKKQPYPTYVYEDLLKQYSAEELSGKPETNSKKYRISFISNTLNLPANDVAEQNKTSGADCPTLLETLTYWFTLRYTGTSLNWDSTYVRLFNLVPKRVDLYDYVVSADVSDGGGADVDYSDVLDGSAARLRVRPSSLVPSLVSLSSLDLQANTEALNRLNDTLKRIFNRSFWGGPT